MEKITNARLVQLRFDGKYKDMPGENRQWTLLSHYVDQQGCDRFKGSFGLEGLKEIGVVTTLKGEKQL